MPIKPLKNTIKLMPAPAPVPNTPPKVPASAPPGAIAGSKTRSASGPAIIKATGKLIWAIIRRVAKTRPCTAGGTFDCQMA